MSFFSHVYWTAGETMASKRLGLSLHGLVTWTVQQARNESFTTSLKTQSDGDLREALMKKLVRYHVMGPSQRILIEDQDLNALPLRELPPGNVATLYLLYLAFVRVSDASSPPASKATFYQVAKRWQHCLVFRRKSDHAMCFECSRLKAAMRQAKEPCKKFAMGIYAYHCISNLKSNI